MLKSIILKRSSKITSDIFRKSLKGKEEKEETERNG
jgi:hypothetical protein